jgi:hypothetical protein
MNFNISTAHVNNFQKLVLLKSHIVHFLPIRNLPRAVLDQLPDNMISSYLLKINEV